MDVPLFCRPSICRPKCSPEMGCFSVLASGNAEGGAWGKELIMYNQEAKQDKGKARLSLVPSKIIYGIARIRGYGNKKYKGSDSWKTVEIERYRDAAYRHLLDYIDNPEGVDEESGLPHLWHLACNVAFLCEMEDEME